MRISWMIFAASSGLVRTGLGIMIMIDNEECAQLVLCVDNVIRHLWKAWPCGIYRRDANGRGRRVQ